MTYGIGHTLPSVVYAIREDDDNFKLATTRSNALAGTSVSFGSSGSGNAHKLIMTKSNEKTLITVDNLVQYPLLYTPLVHTLSGNDGSISAASSIFALSGISTLAANDILICCLQTIMENAIQSFFKRYMRVSKIGGQE